MKVVIPGGTGQVGKILRCVIPKRLLDAEFTFEFPSWPHAAADLVTQVKGSKI